MAGKGQPKTGGRQPGVTNKATQQAREAIAEFVNGNSHRLQEWLDRIADGVPEYDADGNVIDYKIAPNPQKAFELYQSVIEYHVPKLARTESAIEHSGEVGIRKIEMELIKPT